MKYYFSLILLAYDAAFYHRKSDLNQEITPYVCWFFGSNYSSTPGLTSGQFSNSQGNLVYNKESGISTFSGTNRLFSAL